jgi:phenylacetic acid degradation operon negative regulatory protein
MSNDVANNLSPKKLILNLLLATDQGVLSTSEAVKAAELFDISSTNVRVTLARLVSSGHLEATSRGEYRLSKQGQVLAAVVSKWRNAEEELRAWLGEWIVAVTSGLPKSDRAAARVRHRAFGLMGFQDLGAEVPVFVVRQFDAQREAKARSLWDGFGLAAAYKAERNSISQWLKRRPKLSLDVAARETFLVGDAAIHRLVFDPLLPSPLVDEDARRIFRQELVHFESVGRQIWRDFLAS